jgi:hypothetical protein
MNTKYGGNVKGRNVGSGRWKKNEWVSTNVTGAVVSVIVGEVVPKANGRIKQVRDAVKCNRSIV